MLPIRDDVPSRSFPAVTLAIILINIAVFVWQWQLGPLDEVVFVHRFGLVPAAVASFVREGPGVLPIDFDVGPRRFEVRLPVDLFHVLRAFLACMFVHGGIAHLAGNLWILWIFGNNVEDRMGCARFLAFYLLCGIGASIVHVLTNPDAAVPTIGASGAIAGVLGAYMVSFPRARILTLVPIFLFATILNVPAVVYLGLWFLLQVVSSAASGGGAGGVAWWAHIGGFVLGIVLLPIFAKRRRVEAY